GLAPKQKELIEEEFRKGTIKIICCTPTLAAGVDLPAFRTVIRDLKRYSGNWGMSYIPVLEYYQMAGRAGRPGMEDYGEAIIVAGSEAEMEELVDRYVYGHPEPITSKLAVEPVLRTYVLSLVASRLVNSREKLLDFFKRTFWAHQYKDMTRLEVILDKVIDLLEDFEFIRVEGEKQNPGGNEFISADTLTNEGAGETRITATLLGRKVAELYIDPLTAHDMMLGIRKAVSKGAGSFGILHLIFSTLEMRPHLRVKTREIEEVEEKLAEFEHEILTGVPSMFDIEYEPFLRTVKTALCFNDWMNEKDEEWLLEKYDIRPGELRAKLERAEWLFHSATELAKLMSFRRIVPEIQKVRLRVKHGVKEELLPLLKLKNVGRVRARKLFSRGIKTISDVRRTDIETLSRILGPGIASGIKKQLGQEVRVVPKGRRKGQLSLEKTMNS
ncbi:ski2-like helicase, partial [Candidatus Woesearchaeota archaeon]